MSSAVVCHVCGAEIGGEPAGSGVLLFVRGDDVEREDQPLCESCAVAIGVTAFARFAEQEEEG